MFNTGVACELVHTGKYSVFEALFGTTFKCLSEGTVTLEFLLNVFTYLLLFLLSYYVTHSGNHKNIHRFVLGCYGVFLVVMTGFAIYPFLDVLLSGATQ